MAWYRIYSLFEMKRISWMYRLERYKVIDAYNTVCKVGLLHVWWGNGWTTNTAFVPTSSNQKDFYPDMEINNTVRLIKDDNTIFDFPK